MSSTSLRPPEAGETATMADGGAGSGLNVGNLVVGGGLLAFCAGVYYYSIAVSHEDPFDDADIQVRTQARIRTHVALCFTSFHSLLAFLFRRSHTCTRILCYSRVSPRFILPFPCPCIAFLFSAGDPG
jgi:hypothetical protein